MTEYDENTIRKNIEEIYKDLDGKATLLAATKTVPYDVINKIYDMGVHTIGENRVNELLEKYDNLDKRFDIQFIGTLQKNKVKYIIDKVSLIHSLDSIPLAEEIEKRAGAIGKVQNVLVEINLGAEESKSGVEPDEAKEFVNRLCRFPHIKVCGLMGVLPKSDNNEKNIAYFRKIKQIFIDIAGQNVDNSSMDNIRMEILSLGMTHDYVDAVKCGSNLVRIGEGIFGKREYNTVKN